MFEFEWHTELGRGDYCFLSTLPTTNLLTLLSRICCLYLRFFLLQTSPSGFNLQPTHILLLRDAQLKSIVSEHAMLGIGNKYRTLDASGVAIFCTDLMPGRRIDRIYQLESDSGIRDDGYLAVMKVASSFLTGEGSASAGGGSSGGDYLDSGRSFSHNRISTFLKQTIAHALSPLQPMPTMEEVESWSYKNAGILSSIYTLAATAHGLSTCMMEGYDARRVKEILRVPDRYGIPLMVATGYDYCGEVDGKVNISDVVHADFLNGDAEEDMDGHKRKTPRLEMNELFFGDTFGEQLDFLIEKQNSVVNAEVA